MRSRRPSPVALLARVALVAAVALPGIAATEGSAFAGGSAVPTIEVNLDGSWRTSIDASDRAPGFQAVAGGAELFVGVAWGWVGFAVGGRGRGGTVLVLHGATFVDAAGDLALQLLLGERTRLRLGGEAGRAFLGDATAWFAAAFVEGSFDVAQFGGGRAALDFHVRLDLDDYLTDATATPFPRWSTALGAGFGVRY